MSTLVNDRVLKSIVSYKIAFEWRLVLEIEDADLFYEEFNEYHSKYSYLEECYIPKKTGTVIGYARYCHPTGLKTLKASFVGRLVDGTPIKTEQETFDVLDEAVPKEEGMEYIKCSTKLVVQVTKAVHREFNDD